MYDLIFNDRRTEDRDWGDSTGGACKQQRYLGGIYVESRSQDLSDGIDIKTDRSKSVDRNKLPKAKDSQYDVSDYTRISNLQPPGNIIQAREDNLKQFQEIGGKASDEDDDMSGVSAEHAKPRYIKKPKITSNDRSQETELDDFDDLDSLLAFDQKDLYTSGCLQIFFDFKYLILYCLLHLYIIYTLP